MVTFQKLKNWCRASKQLTIQIKMLQKKNEVLIIGRKTRTFGREQMRIVPSVKNAADSAAKRLHRRQNIGESEADVPLVQRQSHRRGQAVLVIRTAGRVARVVGVGGGGGRGAGKAAKFGAAGGVDEGDVVGVGSGGGEEGVRDAAGTAGDGARGHGRRRS